MGLPYLLVHGAWFWKVVLAATTAMVTAAVWLASRGRARRAVRRTVAGLDEARDEGVVRGTLGGAVASLHVVTSAGEQATTDQRDERVWIETPEGKVALVGAIRVLAGTHAIAARGIPRGTPEALVEAQPWHDQPAMARPLIARGTYLTVAAGDEVIARGRLERVAAGETVAADYRADAGALELHPSGDDAPIALAARAARAPRRSRWLAFVLLAGATGFVTYKIEHALGKHWLDACWGQLQHDDDLGRAELNGHSDHVDPMLPWTNDDVCVKAAAMPGTRGDALYVMNDLADGHPALDEASLQQQLALADLHGGCASVLERVARTGRYDDMLAQARRCGDRRLEYTALVDLGKFSEAAAIHVPADVKLGQPALPSVEVLVLAGRWSEAAGLVDHRAAVARAGTPDPNFPDGPAYWGTFYKCVAELLRAHAGDAGAVARLRALHAGPYAGACIPALAEVVAPAERASLLASGDFPSSASGLLWMTENRYQQPDAILVDPEDSSLASALFPVWDAETAGPPADGEDPRVTARRERYQAVAATLAGDLAAARAHAERAQKAAAQVTGEDAMFELRDVQNLPAAIALYSPDTTATFAIPHLQGIDDQLTRSNWLHDNGDLLLRHGDPLADGTYFGPEGDYLEALRAAEQGDGSALVDAITPHRYHMTWWRAQDVLAVLPRVKTGRDVLARRLAWILGEQTDEYGFPWTSALHAALRRTILELAGDRDEAARQAAIYQSYDAALRDRDKRVALLLLAQ